MSWLATAGGLSGMLLGMFIGAAAGAFDMAPLLGAVIGAAVGYVGVYWTTRLLAFQEGSAWPWKAIRSDRLRFAYCPRFHTSEIIAVSSAGVITDCTRWPEAADCDRCCLEDCPGRR